jgi:sugar O-acyltransferase (sialic acid O-acetyltransferase NeuD family)
MDNILIIGGGGHAKVVISILKKHRSYNILGYFDRNDNGDILSVKYIGDDSNAPNIFRNGCNQAALGLGQLRSSLFRRQIVELYSNIGFEFPTIISHSAQINEDVLLGNGTVVMDGTIINSGTRIGTFSILNTSSSIDHDCKIGDFTHIAPGVTLSGGVEIGMDCLIGTGSTIIQYKTITSNVIVGAGSVVTKDIQESGVYVGVPARRVK